MVAWWPSFHSISFTCTSTSTNAFATITTTMGGAYLADPAIARAERLLTELLTAEQKEALQRSFCFHVLSETGRKYCIRRGRARNVFRLSDDEMQILTVFCLHPDDPDIPNADVLLAQKLMLEAAEDEFLRLANSQSWSLPH